jgi:hypothetical protein
MDGLLAATAIHHNLTIVSRNLGDFTNTQVPVVNPWEPWHAESNWQPPAAGYMLSMDIRSARRATPPRVGH